jgi:RNA polymerase sigma-70 factor, ECF subfamily
MQCLGPSDTHPGEEVVFNAGVGSVLGSDRSFPLSVTTEQRELDSSDDVALVHAAKLGDMAALELLLKRHTTLIFRVAMHILGLPEDAEDVVQESFLKAFQHLQHFEERARFSTWLTRIAVNEALTKLRSSRRVTTVSIHEETDESTTMADKVADWRPNPEQLYNRAELREILRQALASLPHSYRVVFLLRDVEGLSILETAEMLGLCVANVKARLFRARLKLRKFLSRYFEKGESNSRMQHILGELRASAAEM